MSEQWQYFLKNLGQWEGKFSHYSPQGDWIEDISSLVTIESKDNNSRVHFVLQRFYPNRPPHEMVLEFTSLGPDIMFCPNGAFSQGSLQSSAFSQFGAELGLIAGDRRLRIVQVFDQGSLKRVTIIPETRLGVDIPPQDPLTVEQLLGCWRGQAITVNANLQVSEPYEVSMELALIEDDRLKQSLCWSQDKEQQTIESTAKIEGSCLRFDQGECPVKILLLPDGASVNCPQKIQPDTAFFLEAGWLVSGNKRQRLIRNYNSRGECLTLTLVQEEKVNC